MVLGIISILLELCKQAGNKLMANGTILTQMGQGIVRNNRFSCNYFGKIKINTRSYIYN